VYFAWFVVKNSDPCAHSARVLSPQVLAVADLLVDRAGGARHHPGMAQKSTDEARRPPGTGPFLNRRPPRVQIIKMLQCEEHTPL